MLCSGVSRLETESFWRVGSGRDAWGKNFDFCVCGNRGDRAYFVGDLVASQADSRDDGRWWGVENTAGVL